MRAQEAEELAKQAFLDHFPRAGRPVPQKVIEGWVVMFYPEGTDWVFEVGYAPPQRTPGAGLWTDLEDAPTQIMVTIRVTQEGVVTLEESPDILW
jgi:hypothetical protein